MVQKVQRAALDHHKRGSRRRMIHLSSTGTKIEESFMDLKILIALDKVMNRQQENMEKMLAMVMLAYSMGVMLREAFCDGINGPPDPA
jgi:hypothetical protein